MSESRTDRLIRIRDAAGFRGIPGVTADDVRWLLSQIGADVEYRVEDRQLGAADDAWRPVGPATYPDQLTALRQSGSCGIRYEVRVTSAPVQVWTPVEEDQR